MRPTREMERKAEKIANERARGVSCDRGGCDFHSGHEPCSRDSAWQSYYECALDEIAEAAETLEAK